MWVLGNDPLPKLHHYKILKYKVHIIFNSDTNSIKELYNIAININEIVCLLLFRPLQPRYEALARHHHSC